MKSLLDCTKEDLHDFLFLSGIVNQGFERGKRTQTLNTKLKVHRKKCFCLESEFMGLVNNRNSLFLN